MTLEDQLLKAVTVAARVHQHQLRKDGTPYVAHVVRVAFGCEDTLCRIVALMHDTLEDTVLDEADLREYGFSQEVIDAVVALSRRPGETYADFIQRAKKNEIARVVKIADIRDNLNDQSALDPEEARFLRDRYERALRELVTSEL